MKIVIDNIKCKVIREPGDPSQILRNLSDYMAVPDPNRYFVDAYSQGYWDGNYRLLTKANYFPTGLLPFVLKFLKSEEHVYSLLDQRGEVPIFPDRWDFSLGPIDLRDYQKEVIEKLVKDVEGLRFPRGIVNAATNAGKDYIMASIHKNIPVPTLLLIHNTEIYKKAVLHFSQYFEVGEIKSGCINPKNFTIAMQKTLLNASRKDVNVNKYLKSLGCVMVDEGHRAVGKEYQILLSKITAPMRLLFSGTPLEMDNMVKKMKLVGGFGPELVKIENTFLIEGGFSQKPILRIYDAQNWSGLHLTYRDEYEEVVMFNQMRADLIAGICKQNKGKQILISFKEIKHGEFLLDNLLLSGLNTTVEIVHGEDRYRDEKIQSFKEGNTQILLSSMILKEGVNIPNINVLILAHGGKSPITLKQYIGRALRHDGISDEVSIIDFYDHGKNVSGHSRKRFKLYQNEGFEIQYQYEHNKFGTPL